MNGKKDRPLALMIAVYTGASMVGAMAVYAVFQYFFGSGHTVVDLALAHLSHVVVIGALTYAVLYVVLLKKVVRPIDELSLKLYAVGKGDLSPASIASNIAEIRQIADGINLMLAKMEEGPAAASLRWLYMASKELRGVAKNPEAMNSDARERVLGVANILEEMATSGLKEAPELERVAT